jgi:hypothetical protein
MDWGKGMQNGCICAVVPVGVCVEERIAGGRAGILSAGSAMAQCSRKALFLRSTFVEKHKKNAGYLSQARNWPYICPYSVVPTKP